MRKFLLSALCLLWLPLAADAQIFKGRFRKSAPEPQQYQQRQPVQQAEPEVLELSPATAKRMTPYQVAAFEATIQKVPLLVFVDCKPPVSEKQPWGVVYECRAGEWFDISGETLRGVAIGIPHLGSRRADLDAKATWADITARTLRLANMRNEVEPVARPFQPEGQRLFDRLEAADVKEKPAVWPAGLRFPRGLLPFTRARLTQVVYNRTRTDPALRWDAFVNDATKHKWLAPGGLVYNSDYYSDLYRLVPEEKAWRGTVQVFNVRNNQPETSYQRSYGDGTIFVDVLSNSQKEVFEVRVREKDLGDWIGYVAYRKREARPVGYTGLRVSCASCHSEAGTGNYNSGLVPGGDTVLSDPLIGLER